jgi:hypothetical protein
MGLGVGDMMWYPLSFTEYVKRVQCPTDAKGYYSPGICLSDYRAFGPFNIACPGTLLDQVKTSQNCCLELAKTLCMQS